MKKLLICLLVLVCLTGLCFAADAKPIDEAKATWTDGTTTFEGTLVECFAKASEAGGTVTMLEDADGSGNAPYVRNGENDADYTLGCYKAFTLDLNGKTLTTQKGGIYVNGGEEGGVFTMKNGVVRSTASTVNVRNVAVQFDNVTLWSDKGYNLGYYVAEDTYNKDNLIENCTFASAYWYCISFNDATVNQEKASITVINSTLAALKYPSSSAVGLQTKPEGSKANIVFGEGVKIYSLAKAHTHKAVTVLGEPLVLSADKTVTVLGELYEGLNEWATPEKPSVDLSTVIPGETAPTTEKSPALRKVELTPFTPPAVEEPAEKKEDVAKPAPKQPTQAPQQEAGSSTGLIIAIIAAVAVAAVVVIAIVGKKKK